MQNLPQDPIMLLSYVNTKLRDNYSSLCEFCEYENVDSEEILQKIKAIGYEYNAEKNKFI